MLKFAQVTIPKFSAVRAHWNTRPSDYLAPCRGAKTAAAGQKHVAVRLTNILLCPGRLLSLIEMPPKRNIPFPALFWMLKGRRKEQAG